MDQATLLRTTRETLRMTQAHLAAASGVSKRTVIRAEQGKTISAENLRALCSVLNLNAAELPLPEERRPLTPRDVLRTHIANLSEEVVWEDVPLPSAWFRDFAFPVWAKVHLASALGAAVAAVLFLKSASNLWTDADAYGLALAALGTLASLGALGLVAGKYLHLRNRGRRLGRRLHALTAQAFYTAEISPRGQVTRIQRTELPVDRDSVRVTRDLRCWPTGRVIRLGDNLLDPNRQVVEGLPDMDGLALMIRGEGRLAA